MDGICSMINGVAVKIHYTLRSWQAIIYLCSYDIDQ